ncbi:hypothetical protein Tco_1011443, partial [Tanacetum coccineum]
WCMTRSSTKELFTPFKNPKRVFRSKRRLFETPGLVESSSPEFDLFSDIEEHSEEEATQIMTETMEQYMSKTRGNYSGSKHEDANEPIEKVLEIVDLFHIPEEVILFYNGLDVPTRQILDSIGVIPTKTAADAKITQQSRREIKKVNEKAIHGCTYYDDWKEAREVKILETYDRTLPQKEKDPWSFTLHCFIIMFSLIKPLLTRSKSSVMHSLLTNLGLLRSQASTTVYLIRIKLFKPGHFPSSNALSYAFWGCTSELGTVTPEKIKQETPKSTITEVCNFKRYTDKVAGELNSERRTSWSLFQNVKELVAVFDDSVDSQLGVSVDIPIYEITYGWSKQRVKKVQGSFSSWIRNLRPTSQLPADRSTTELEIKQKLIRASADHCLFRSSDGGEAWSEWCCARHAILQEVCVMPKDYGEIRSRG